MATSTISSVEDLILDEEEYGEDEEEYDEYDEGEDLDAEAEEMAQRLQEQLRADIVKAQQEAAAAAVAYTTGTVPNSFQKTQQISSSSPTIVDKSSIRRKRHDAAIVTMKAIISCAAANPLVHDTLSTFLLSTASNANVLEVLNRCISSGVVLKGTARPLSEAVIALAKSDVLFASLRNSDAPAIQLDRGKRRWDDLDHSYEHASAPPHKRVAIDQPDLIDTITEAVRVISDAFSRLAGSLTTQPPEATFVQSIHPQLHQVFLFAVTSAPRAGDRTAALQELAGLIQMLGVLSGIPIGSHSPTASQPPSHLWGSVGSTSQQADLGSAVYPCLVPGCTKVFNRLFSLRAHQRLHTLVDRPFRCTHCPASFVRNHDLKRHTKLHDKKAWRCSGCGKIFSRRDAIKRHKDSRGRYGGKGRNGEVDMGESVCAYAETEEVEVDKPDGEEEATRRAKMWNDISANQLTNASHAISTHGGPPGSEAGRLEEGEHVPGIVEHAQVIVLELHSILQAYVAKGLGGSPFAPNNQHPSQATLASIIARSQTVLSESSLAGPSLDPSGSRQPDQPPGVVPPTPQTQSLSTALSLSEEQRVLLEQAIAQAALAAQAQAEAEAALEEEEEASEDDEDE